jgi:flagella basal body P-ring formation protein FlgA
MINQYIFNKLSTKIIFYCINVLLFLLSPITYASAYQSHSSIYKTAKTYISGKVLTQNSNQATVTVGKLDSRLKLKKCSKRLQAFLPKGSRQIGKTTVGVKCKGRKPWSLHVPVTISVFGDVLIAKRQLKKGSVLLQSDLRMERYDLAELPHGYVENILSGAGMKLKRRVMAGTVITPSMLKKPRIVSRGQKVTIIAKMGSMQVRMEGKALAHGAAGERIRVMNINSRKKVEGVITPKGEVRVEI